MRWDNINILHICPDYPPLVRGGGAETFKLLTENWSLDGNCVTVITSTPHRTALPTKGSYDKSVSSYRLVPLPPTFSEARFFSPLYPLEHLRLMRWIKSECHKYDYIIVNGITETISREFLLHIPSSYLDKVILIDHGIPTADYSWLFSTFSRFIHKTIGKVLVEKLRSIVVFSEASEKEYVNTFGLNLNQRIHKILLGMDFAQFKELFINLSKDGIKKSEILIKLGINKNFIFSIGRNVRTKGFEQLIYAFSEIASDFSDLELVIAGDLTDYTKYLISISKKLNILDRVKFIGRIDEATKIALMITCKLFLIPSVKEGFGLNALEARVLSVKTLATCTGAHEAILDDPNCDMLIREPYKELTKSMTLLLESEKCFPQWNNEIESRFDIRITALELLKMMKNMNSL